MSLPEEGAALERLRAAVSEQLGFALEDERLEQLGHAVGARIGELGLSGLDAYLDRLRAPVEREAETAVLAELVTVTETFFWRHYDQLRAFVEAVVPERTAARGRRLRVLSAGCASGEEPYSLAIALSEAIPELDAWDVKILGLDLNRSMLEKAKRGRYTPWSLRSTPEAIKRRYFRAEGREFVLAERVTKLVELREQNLALPAPGFFRELAVDVVFCRNVLMYFTPESMRGVIAALTSALAPGGYLFLGHAETLRGLSHDFQLCHTHGAFYYRLRDEEARRAGTPAGPPPALATPEAAILPQAVDETLSWFDAIQAATRRVSELSDRAGATPPHPRTKNGARPEGAAARGPGIAEVLELVERERFDAALALLESLPSDVGRRPDALLLSAVLLTNNGRLAEAERTCRALLAADDLNAGAHYLTALCREHAGDTGGAAEHDRIAVHLDPTFAMPHLHVGLLAKRSGDAASARRDLGRALTLLEREETSRLVLFAGGFSREGLIALCRAELARLGGAA